MFIDEVKLKFIAGKGGDGIVSRRREKYIPKGGPRGGNGGKGGDVILRANPNINTLSEFRHKKVIKAPHGESGGTQEMAGHSGDDLFVDIPVGTLVKNNQGEIIFDLSEDWQEYTICYGGRGGFGNSHFASSIRQAPAFAELGDVGEEIEVILELKLVADIGIIGLPNAGKSTLIKSITNVKPKIADYPFTTIVPNLGVLDYKGKSLVLEDVPGLIEGASEGKGLGHTFLKHIERTRVIIHLVDLNGLDNIIANYKTIRNELEKYSQDLAKKEEILVLSKADLFDKEMIDFITKEVKKELKIKNPIFVISAPANIGVDELKDFLIDNFERKEKIIKGDDQENSEVKFFDLKNIEDPRSFEIKDLGNMEFEVIGKRIEQIVRMTDMGNYEAIMRVIDILEKIGAIKKIKSLLELNYRQKVEMYFFESDDKEDILPKVYIAGRCFNLDKIFFDFSKKNVKESKF